MLTPPAPRSETRWPPTRCSTPGRSGHLLSFLRSPENIQQHLPAVIIHNYYSQDQGSLHKRHEMYGQDYYGLCGSRGIAAASKFPILASFSQVIFSGSFNYCLPPPPGLGEGEITLILHTTQLNAKKSDSFYIPPKNYYNLINQKAREAELSLIQFQVQLFHASNLFARLSRICAFVQPLQQIL